MSERVNCLFSNRTNSLMYGKFFLMPPSYNVCIMAYGQTGSGKTHTMLGPEGGKTGRHHRNGVIPLAVGELFK